MTVKIKYTLLEGGHPPRRGRSRDVGVDLTVRSIKKKNDQIPEGINTFIADFGIIIEPPDGYYVELVPRSSLAWSGFIMPNSVGVIDPDYRGILMMPLTYLGLAHQAEGQAKKLIGKRIAQVILRELISPEMVVVPFESMSMTERGEQGFGSSGS